MTDNKTRISIIMTFKTLVSRFAVVALAAAVSLPMVAKTKTAAKSTKIIFTGEIGTKIYGYHGTTPLNIYITNGKIEKIEALKNQESPAYFNKAKNHIFPQYTGKTVAQALKVEADAATGATYSSEAIIKNIKLALSQASTAKSKSKAKTKAKSKSKSK